MKKFYIIGAALLAFVACQQPQNTDGQTVQSDSTIVEKPYVDTTHTSENSVDWMGTYEAVIPCADCPGIKMKVVLNEDKTFEIESEYMERDTKANEAGTFVWYNNGSSVHLTGEDTDLRFKVGENQLFQLDADGKMIEGELADKYVYKKNM